MWSLLQRQIDVHDYGLQTLAQYTKHLSEMPCPPPKPLGAPWRHPHAGYEGFWEVLGARGEDKKRKLRKLALSG